MTAHPSSARRAFAEHVVDLLRGLGPVHARPMFGGHGLFLSGLMFGLLADARMFIKVDAESLPAFEAEGCRPFVFEARGRQVALTYREAPSEALDQPDAAVRWARLGVAAAQRAVARKPGRTEVAGLPRGRRTGSVSSVVDAGGVNVKEALASDLLALPNLGPRSVEMLAQAGIHSQDQLRALGAVRAYAQVRGTCARVSLNLLWAMEGALSLRPWQQVAQDDRASLLMALEDAAGATGESPPRR